ncbi:MAG: hypothetical protein MR852_03345 [Treponema sp.]|nr:hypothetical protein [Treponema sp.]
MFKKSFLLIFFVLFSISLYAQNNSYTIQYLKGNITDKTRAIKESTGSESDYLANRAIEYALENKELLGTDRDLDALVVAAVLSISDDYLKNSNDEEKVKFSEKLYNLYSNFEDSNTVEIAILTKLESIKDLLPIEKFVNNLNNKLKNENMNDMDPSFLKTTLSSLEKMGNTESFIILYYFYSADKYPKFEEEIEKTLITLSPNAVNEILGFIKEADSNQLKRIYSLTTKTQKLSKNNVCIIAENLLNRSILLMGDSSKILPEDIDLQITCLKILADNKWTRASDSVLSYFQITKSLYKINSIKDEDFTFVISSLSSITPLKAVSPLTSYLEELNGRKENCEEVSSSVILSLINTLGAIGDKAAFDSLLAVTYLSYEEAILSAARQALSGLRWQ